MDPTERERLIEELVERYRQTLGRQLEQDPQTLDQIEQLVEEVSIEMDRALEERLLERPEGPPENQARCPFCPGVGRYRAVHPRTLLTRHGERTLRRRYYYCATCRQGFAPLDQRLGLDREATSTQVRLWIARRVARETFAEAAQTLAELAGLTVSPSTVARIATAVGTALRQAEQETARQHHVGRGPVVARKPQRLYVSMDGIMAPLRNRWQRDGAAGPLVCRYGECKTAVVYEARRTPAGDEGVLWQAYTATFGNLATFEPLLATLAHRAGHHFAREVVFLADGLPCNWRLAATQFPGAVQILDFVHATEHLYTVAKAYFGEGTSPVEPWVKARQDELFRDDVGAVVREIQDWQNLTAAQAEIQAREAQYFARNAERLRYGTFRKHGYQIASGVMEASCKRVVHQRLDEAGMHWTLPTAEAVVALRAAILSAGAPDLRPFCRATA
jgi:hypothetical protein